MRDTVVVVGLVALVCGVVDARPKAMKRRGTFAAYIDPAAPDDPPRPTPPPPPPEPDPTPLSIVMLVDRSVGTAGASLDAAKQAMLAIDNMTWGDDRIALLAFDDEVDYVLRPACAGDKRIMRAIRKLAPAAGPSNLAGALADACEYMKEAPDRKLIVLFASDVQLDDNLDKALRCVRETSVHLIAIAMPGANLHALQQLPTEDDARWALEGPRDSEMVGGIVYDQHYLEAPSLPQPLSPMAPSMRSILGTGRFASPPAP